MDKQKLARTLWSTVEDLRGNIEAYTYKDYILGLLFYKFLSDKEYEYLNKELEIKNEDIYNIIEDNKNIVVHCKNNIGYFIEPKNFYKTWLNNINDFTEDDLITSLQAYERHISNNTKHVFEGVFDTISRNLTSLAPSSNERTKSLRKLILALRDIPTINTEYDVLGYVYEYLISKFSAGAGKKSGEFFTPSEVSTVIARIVSYNLKNRETITVLDPTCGSGSLLLAVGNTFEKAKHKKNKVKYYYQEKNKSTYDMCRQNLVMRGVIPSNMVGRNGDTLDLDYPYFEDNDPEGTYEPCFVDAVVANPPYSQKYDSDLIKDSARFNEYGLPPASKADYAFLLHGLYHLKNDGIQVIVLPHGVLFRNEEAEIRTKLIKKYQIEAVIGLGANIFFGTGIPTCLIILKKHRTKDDILFIDASKCFIKDGNKNKLRESDIQKIVDAYIARKDIEKFSRLVSYKEIEENDFNLNISRYVSAEEDPESYDAFGVMNGAIPKKELEEKFKEFWTKFPTLYYELFKEINSEYVILKIEDIIETINNNKEVERFKEQYNEIIDEFTNNLKNYLLKQLFNIDLSNILYEIKERLFDTLNDFKLIDNYNAYQAFYDVWKNTELDIESLHEEKNLNPIHEIVEVTKINNKKEEVFDYWEGRIIPFNLIQNKFLREEKDRFNYLENRKAEIKGELDSLVSMLDEEDGNKVLNDNKDAFSKNDVKNELDEILKNIDTEEIRIIKKYLNLLDNKSKKNEKLDFIKNHNEVKWDIIEKSKDGTVSKNNMNDYYKSIQTSYKFEEDSLGYILSQAKNLKDEESENNKEIKILKQELQDKSIEITKKNLSDEEIYELLEKKWIDPVNESLKDLIVKIFNDFENKLNEIIEKYGDNIKDLEKKEKEIDRKLQKDLSSLVGSSADMTAINDFMKMLGDING